MSEAQLTMKPKAKIVDIGAQMILQSDIGEMIAKSNSFEHLRATGEAKGFEIAEGIEKTDKSFSEVKIIKMGDKFALMGDGIPVSQSQSIRHLKWLGSKHGWDVVIAEDVEPKKVKAEVVKKSAPTAIETNMNNKFLEMSVAIQIALAPPGNDLFTETQQIAAKAFVKAQMTLMESMKVAA
jgi:hypothetical protein